MSRRAGFEFPSPKPKELFPQLRPTYSEDNILVPEPPHPVADEPQVICLGCWPISLLRAQLAKAWVKGCQASPNPPKPEGFGFPKRFVDPRAAERKPRKKGHP